MSLVYGFIVSLFGSIVSIPPLMRWAGPLRLLDEPDKRKLHASPVPRVGGIGMALAVLFALSIWLTFSEPIVAFLAGGAIVLTFGILDDRRSLNYKWKFAGQLLAAAAVVQGGVLIEHLPFLGLDSVPWYLSYPVTVLFILGTTNAFNLFDGLDGLAAGCAFLTLTVTGLLAFLAGDTSIPLIAACCLGALVGFLRYNTHPAAVFMGDAGSQLLGFTTGILAILLVEHANTALNPMVPLFLLGLPVIDTLWVMTQRISMGRSPFIADRNHFHHKLLDLGLTHYESVALIYILHGLMVGSVIFLGYESDTLLLAGYIVFCAVMIGLYYLLQGAGWHGHGRNQRDSSDPQRDLGLKQRAWLQTASLTLTQYGIAAALIILAFVPVDIPKDLAVLSAGMAGVIVVAALILAVWTGLFARLGIYSAGLVGIYLSTPTPIESWLTDIWINGYLIALAAILFVAIRTATRDQFRVLPQDLLVLFLAIVLPNLPGDLFGEFPIRSLMLRMGVLFYACEFLLYRDPSGHSQVSGFRLLRVASVLSLTVLSVRGW